jgi:hypothetical protein
MRHNVPRLGESGGFVHFETSALDCVPEDKQAFQFAVDILTKDYDEALMKINNALSIPADEYVPAIADVFEIIDRTRKARK